MAEQILEALQSSHRQADYYPYSDDDEVLDFHPAKTTTTTTESASLRNAPRTATHPVPSFEPLFKSFENARGTTQPTPPPIHKQSTRLHAGLSTGRSLLDEMDDVSFELTPMFSQNGANSTTIAAPAGVVGFLEIEEEPPRGGGGMYDDSMDDAPSSNLPLGILEDDDEPIRTNSGLLLTHRRTPVMSRTNKSRPQFNNNYDDDDNKKYDIPFLRLPSAFRPATPSSSSRGGGGGGNSPYGDSGDRRHSMALLQAKRLMSYVRIWVVFLFVFLLAATGVLVHSFRSSNSDVSAAAASGKQSKAEPIQRISPGMADHIEDLPERIILVPIENASEWASRQHLLHQYEQPEMQIGHDTHNRRILKHNKKDSQEQHGVRRILLELRQEFETWADEHGKKYQSAHQKEERFHIWANNHQRTAEKNRRHGLCKLTKQHVFGSTPFKDLTQEEFKMKYLTGYKGPRAEELEQHHQSRALKLGLSGVVLDPKVHKVNMHDTVKQRVLEQNVPVYSYPSETNCSWYDVSCWLRWVWRVANLNLGSLIGTMEPKYDADSYPTSVDWRTLGAVSSVRYQGACGACWAITAVETVESAHFLATGTLYNLAESEIILCDSSCEMCEGGWPQNAFAWVMDHGGLPLQKSFSYDASFLNALTQAWDGTSNAYYTKDDVSAYKATVCPDEDSGGGSGDKDKDKESDQTGQTNANYVDNSSSGRYGNIKGYGYATSRCVCYSDGSGCNCDNQDEGLAIGNLATYGPAVVCVEASLWQDYSGGIMTSEVGCSQKFLDMNHCVQVVGYAFSEQSDEDKNDANGNRDEGDHNKDGDKDKRDGNSRRNGYWIVRNQWGTSWGMSGYAYVAMGENTCGVLNDMTQAYL